MIFYYCNDFIIFMITILDDYFGIFMIMILELLMILEYSWFLF